MSQTQFPFDSTPELDLEVKTKTGFIYQGDLYIRVIPGKKLFRSTMVHEVVNRGDIFAMRMKDQMLTIVSGNITPELIEIKVAV